MQQQVSREQQELAAALQQLETRVRRECFDIINPDSKPTTMQQEVINDFGLIRQQWIRAGNQSGKSQTCARIISWVLQGGHPSWTKPVEWGDEPLLIIVAGRTGKQIEESLLPKLKSYLDPGSYREIRVGNIIQKLEMANGDRIVFQSLENPNVARERLQSYVAHITWCDELPPDISVVRELLVRTQARRGYNMFSFTPTVVNVDIQRFVDSLTLPEGRVYRFHMLDNPLYSDPKMRGDLLARYSHMPEHMQKAIFEGEWISSENQVYYFNYMSMVEQPQGYSPVTWRHVESVDPALKSALGLTIWAEDPSTGVWYCILADYIKGIYVPTELVAAVRKITERFNIVRRIADPHEVWYIETARSMGLTYRGVHKKNERKSELIKQLQEFLGTRIRLSPSCEHLVQELQECRWSDRAANTIVNASSYHLLDSAMYFCDEIPAREQKIMSSSWESWLYQKNEERKKIADDRQNKINKIRIRRGRR